MSIGANSYGSTAGVAGLTPRYASGGDFTTGTRPTLAQTESYVDSISGMVNSMLAEVGFTIPVTNDSVKDALDFFVIEEVASIVEGINGSGRFGPTAKVVGSRGRFSLLLDDVKAFVNANKTGFERLGAARSYSATAGLAFRDVDESGDATNPIFQRKGFGNVFENWDE